MSTIESRKYYRLLFIVKIPKSCCYQETYQAFSLREILHFFDGRIVIQALLDILMLEKVSREKKKKLMLINILRSLSSTFRISKE